VAVRTDPELSGLLQQIDECAVDFGAPFEPEGSAARKIRRLLEQGYLI
jgi:hypothetical protein